MNSQCAIFDELDNSKTLVFPKEVSARSYLASYAQRHPGKAVFADNVLSWDTFKKSCTEVPSNFQKAQFIHRMLFVSHFMSSPDVKKLKHFANTKYSESISRFAKNIAENIVYFKTALENTDRISDNLLHDIKLLYSSYTAFLKENNLYEEFYLTPDFSEVDKHKYVLVFPHSITDIQIDEAIKAGFKIIEAGDDLNPIDVYDNTVCEINNTVRKIYKLLQTEKACDIAVTLNQYESYYPYFESACRIRNIKLSPSQGKPLIRYAGGTFFNDIQTLCATDFDLEALKAFLFNPLYPFKNKELISDDIKTAIENKNQNGTGKICEYAKSFTTCENADELRKIFHNFQDEFFEKESWHILKNEVEKQAFERTLVLIDDIDRTMKSCHMEKLNEFYNVFLRILEGTSYTSNIKTEGIKVYSYPTSLALEVKYHFVLGLSDSQSTVKKKTVPFVHEIDDDLENSITDEVLKVYARKTDNNVVLSCSEESFTGDSSSPALFVEKNLVQRIKGKTALYKEDSFINETLIYNAKKNSIKGSINQKKWYETSRNILLKGLGSPSYPKIENDSVKLDAYRISSYKNCPYKYFCSYVYHVQKTDFTADMSDAKEVGNLIHKVYAEFFKTVKDFRLFSEEKNKEYLKKIFEEKLKEYSSTIKSPDRIHILELEEKYKRLLPEIGKAGKVADALGDYSTDSMEKSFSVSYKDYEISVRMDCIMKDSSGNYVVIDFKKKHIDSSSLQLIVYANTLLSDPEYSSVPVIGAFYSVEDAKFKSIWKNNDEFLSKNSEYLEILPQVIDGIKQGNFNPTPDNDICGECDYSRICRKRFVIK